MNEPRVGSLFAGVEGFGQGFEAAGWRCGWQVEWDKDCRAVLERHFPDVPRWGDVREVTGAELPPVECITYGFPCQDLSIAGRRAGLDGDRSNLFFEATRIFREMREATDGRYPAWVVAENVFGLLSADDGHAMGRVLDEPADCGAVDIEWGVLDARFFGVPQRRRRVFIVARFGPRGDGAGPVFDLAEGSPRDYREGGATWEHVTGAAEAGIDAARVERGALAAAFVKVQRVGAPPSDFDRWRADAVAPSLNTFDNTGEVRSTVLAVSENQRGETRLTPYARQITAGGGKPGQGYAAVLGGDLDVRRLTPRECERLMGWPDDWTRYRADGSELSDGTRNQMIGNGVVAPVARFIGEQILRVIDP